ncbi:DnaJ domain-containing protein [Aliirhizobium terrae]|uniref:DnaJ C-terminal domain-containing protein n=1 Tax=Terrirhizobium terrae TaxID=2926709 RepID=UPI0025765B21|nr:DnaJ C-terminal domain-containing protein [Rhizobium sp. CC-CFT758]WJH39200.1 DnaJ domain-containing protein [Rhizobium sp. CC-CFT758]
MRDPYSILGVKRSAGADEIKAAWRSKAKSIHPDHNRDDPGATDRFTEVGQAYDLLKDPERRQRYDKAAEMHQTIAQQREAAERAKAARANAEKVMEELAKAQAARAQANAQAGAQAGKARQQQASEKGGEKAGESPEETIERIFGGSPEARERAKEHAESTAEQKRADEPLGKDDEHADQRQPLPLMAVELISSLVNRFRGTAPLPEKAPDLSVDAKVTIADLLAQKPVGLNLADEREVRVPIEPGATDGQVVRLKGQGLKVPGMKQGDLLVSLRLARGEKFQVQGYDLHTMLPISLQDAVLGGEARVETPEGSRTITIPSWSGSDQTIKLDGLGLFDDAGGRGKLVVELRVVLWEKPDAKVTDLMRHMRDGLFL